MKTVTERHGHAVYHAQQGPVTNFSVVSTSMALGDPELSE